MILTDKWYLARTRRGVEYECEEEEGGVGGRRTIVWCRAVRVCVCECVQ